MHQDTVPTDGMTIDPFGARIEDGRLYGRGACDVKGGMAAMLTAFARIVREKPNGAVCVVMACTVDEEFTFLAYNGWRKQTCAADAGGRSKRSWPSRRALTWYTPTKAPSAGTCSPAAGRATVLGRNSASTLFTTWPLVAARGVLRRGIAPGRVDPLLGPATLSVGRIEGGVSVNTVPDRCRVEIDRRLLPEEGDAAAGDLLTYLRKHVEDRIAFSFGDPWLSAPPLDPSGSEELVARTTPRRKPGRRQRVASWPSPTAPTLARSRKLGLPCVVFGPGDIARAHTCDEWVPLDEVAAAAEILYRLACLD